MQSSMLSTTKECNINTHVSSDNRTASKTLNTIEIKAYIDDIELLAGRLKALAGAVPLERMQHDTFYACTSGRLKLRCSGKTNELIYYQRVNDYGPKQARYQYSLTSNPGALRHTLAGAFGETGRVRKYRQSYKVGEASIHLDKVAGLGDFIEIKVETPTCTNFDSQCGCGSFSSTFTDMHSDIHYETHNELYIDMQEERQRGIKAVEDLMTILEIDLFQLVDGAYMDLIIERNGGVTGSSTRPIKSEFDNW